MPIENLGDILQSLANRKGSIVNMSHAATSVTVEAEVPTRGLIGFGTDLINCTKGVGVMSHLFKEYAPHKGDIPTRYNGVLVSMEQGVSMGYSLETIQERGRLFSGPQEDIYAGMIIGENSRDNDLDVNCVREKKLTNMRASTADEAIRLVPFRTLNLEQAIEFIAEDEYVEVTPKSLRLRKKILAENRRPRRWAMPTGVSATEA